MDAPSRVETMNDLQKVTEEIVGATPDELVQEGSLIKSILEASDKGPAGKKDLEAIQTTLKLKALIPLGITTLRTAGTRCGVAMLALVTRIRSCSAAGHSC